MIASSQDFFNKYSVNYIPQHLSLKKKSCISSSLNYSHSIVAGGFEEIS
jgi:hypothetical protein